jgi:drug/metabolite transporter (DMT)-like permease
MAAAVLFSTGGAAIKTAAFTPMQVASLRSGIAAITLLAWVRFRPEISARVFGIGAVYAAVLTTFVVATRLTTAANAIFLQSTAPLYLLLLGPLVLGERVRARDLPYLAALGIGLVLCVLGQQEASVTAPDPRTGNLFGLASGVAWALTLTALRWAQRGGHDIGASGVVVGNLLAFAIGLPFVLPLPDATAGEWATIVYLGVAQIGVAYMLLTRALRYLGALEAALLLLIEPVLNPIWTWLIRGETPAVWVLAGGAIIVGTTATQAVVRAGASRPDRIVREGRL